ncbi:aminotransferase class I/II-fold pyridoxal phosphate-dependent enzyme [Streptomyces sp. NPDC047725]|uniref:aminotransferase class I/II-fold pyridoxal phosphate-dependent enzyme n=1 Tax=Streptomyces sp. NPDC047725 TaxID=3365487 RepID=UPI00371F9FC6
MRRRPKHWPFRSSPQLLQIADWAQRHGIWVISDDIYRAFDYTGTYQSILRVAPQLRDRSVVVGGVSEEHAVTGWRVGWLAAPPEIIASTRLHVSRTITHVPTANQRAALAAFGDTGTPARAASDYRRRRALRNALGAASEMAVRPATATP